MYPQQEHVDKHKLSKYSIEKILNKNSLLKLPKIQAKISENCVCNKNEALIARFAKKRAKKKRFPICTFCKPQFTSLLSIRLYILRISAFGKNLIHVLSWVTSSEFISTSEAYTSTCQASQKERFAKINNG